MIRSFHGLGMHTVPCCSNCGGFSGKLVVEVSSSREGVETATEHALGVMVGHCTDLDTKVGQHGVRAPTAKDAGSVRVHTRAEEGGGAAWAQTLHGEKEGIHAGGGVDVASTVL